MSVINNKSYHDGVGGPKVVYENFLASRNSKITFTENSAGGGGAV